MTIQFDGTTGVSSVGSLTVNGDLAVSGSINSTNTFGFKNRIINGAMVIDQRNNGDEVNPAANITYYLDRWITGSSQPSKFKIGQNAGAITPPVGFANYLGITSLSSYTVANGEAFVVLQRIEGFNVADLNWGSASAASVTLSFWVYSSLTGTFGGSLRNSASNRSYPYTYSVPVANTWTQISVTIPGDTTGTWLTTNGIGINLTFCLGAGSTFSGTAGTWASANYPSATGAVSVVGTSGATFYITGVQLEKGSVATGFDYRSYGTELGLCQRYYYKVSGVGVFGSGFSNSTTESRSFVAFPVSMRIAPTALEQSGTASNYQIRSSGGLSTACNGVPTFVNATLNSSFLTATVASGLVAGQGILFDSGSSSGYLAWSAEL